MALLDLSRVISWVSIRAFSKPFSRASQNPIKCGKLRKWWTLELEIFDPSKRITTKDPRVDTSSRLFHSTAAQISIKLDNPFIIFPNGLWLSFSPALRFLEKVSIKTDHLQKIMIPLSCHEPRLSYKLSIIVKMVISMLALLSRDKLLGADMTLDC